MQIRPRYRFVSAATRDAFVYDPRVDFNQWLEVGTAYPFTLYRISAVSAAGVGTFEQMGGGGVPAAHHISHENGGGDQISVAGLTGLLATAQIPTAHAASHLPGGTDALTTAVAGTIQPDDAAAAGTAASFARSDHKHAIVAAAGSQGIGAGNTEGSATSFARSDHDHKFRETGGPTDLALGVWPDGDALVRVGSVAQGSSVSGNSVSIWLPEAPFASPSTYDDEFTADSGWTKFDATTVGAATNDVSNGFARILQPGQSAIKYVGRYKTNSDEDPHTAWWAIDFLEGNNANPGVSTTLTCVVFNGIRSGGTWATTDAAVGVKLVFTARTFADSAGSALVYGIQAISTDWSNLAADTSTAGARANLGYSRVYVRMRRSGTAFYWELSTNGISWIYLSGGTAHAGTSNSRVWGFAYADSGAGTDATRGVLVDFFRVNTSSAAVGTMLGRRRNVVVY